MSAEPHYYAAEDPETALKYAIQHVRGDRVQIIEGVIEPVSPTWDHEAAADSVREQIGPAVRRLGCMAGSGNLDLPGSSNWYVPDLAVVPRELAKGAAALAPDQTLLVVEVTSESNGDTNRVTKRRRYAEYGAPLHLLIDRRSRTSTLFSHPGPLGYTTAEGPHPFGTPIRLPAPFDMELDTAQF
ncbi:Uma2 family endonuclease [Actinacidiphila acididurans]|uniref:Uma2 family endonuclease n=1 Tax=Actinacidiphila acididurans TaxID=2784346 RepID=UPI001F2B7D8E|nr:Uma2 family endonuclease [Actinacidiphila acididurans]